MRTVAFFRPLVACCALAVAGALTALPAGAQTAARDTEADLAHAALIGVQAIGKRWDQAAFAETVRLYTAVHRVVDWPGVMPPETHAYGDHPQQTLRLFRPEQEFSEPSLVILFLAGNGLGNCDPVAPGSDDLIYAHIGKLAARFGGIGVTANYRSGATSDGLAGAEDLRLLISWLADNVADYGGDPGTIVLLAAGEGATSAAHYLFNRDMQLDRGPGLAAAVLISGLFGERAPGLTESIDAYDGPRVPLALWSGEHDPAATEIGIADLYAQLCVKYQDCPSFEQLPGHNPVSHVLSLGTADTGVQNALIRFYHTVR